MIVDLYKPQPVEYYYLSVLAQKRKTQGTKKRFLVVMVISFMHRESKLLIQEHLMFHCKTKVDLSF